jgi:hypothetical protein
MAWGFEIFDHKSTDTENYRWESGKSPIMSAAARPEMVAQPARSVAGNGIPRARDAGFSKFSKLLYASELGK